MVNIVTINKAALKNLTTNKWMIFAIAVASFHFYWNDIRPAMITKDCHFKMRENTKITLELAEKSGTLENYSLEYLRNESDQSFKYCLQSQGLR